MENKKLRAPSEILEGALRHALKLIIWMLSDVTD